MEFKFGSLMKVLFSAPWSEKKLEEAARGVVQGSCDDPPDVQLKFWIEIARDEAGRSGESAIPAITKLAIRALRGEFK
jgi:hypothetical protein